MCVCVYVCVYVCICVGIPYMYEHDVYDIIS